MVDDYAHLIKAYFAGPDVFRDNAEEHYRNLKFICDEYNIQLISPIDNSSDDCCEIYYLNIESIRKSDIVIANLEPFRGPSADVGTAVEIGFAVALGKKIFGYYSHSPEEYKNRVTHYDLSMSLDFPKIEDFGLYDNLMIVHSCLYIGESLEETLKHIKDFYG